MLPASGLRYLYKIKFCSVLVKTDKAVQKKSHFSGLVVLTEYAEKKLSISDTMMVS